jgi:hypothetical protein
MEPLGPATDPTPYIMAAYGMGTLLICGFAAWTFVQRRTLQRLLVAVAPTSRPNGKA